MAYWVAADAGLLDELVHRRQLAPLWPVTGVAMAALLLLGPWVWPGILVGALVSNLLIGSPLPVVLGTTFGNTLAPVCGYLMLRRVGFHNQLDRLRDAFALVFLGAFTSTLISATVGSVAIVFFGPIPVNGFWSTWMLWWTGEALGVLIVTPLLLVIRSIGWPRGVPWQRWVEAAALLAGTFLAIGIALRTLDILFVAFPFLIWAGFRFQLAGTAPCALIASALAVDAAAHGYGPFANEGLLTDMILLQIFNGSIALTALLLAVIITERNRANQEIERTVRQLVDVIDRLGRRGEAGNPADRWQQHRE
ncbi:MASE1 domain-containing protein [Actinopolymorpha alba]|uniref:MASE1 domain-containing protein n=1 Tax=Actinopolymorpha alba TaxID=533267 RepID=UPI000374DDDD|nr:MASE1 domain-containing protein [Actinopolymorpha alba]